MKSNTLKWKEPATQAAPPKEPNLLGHFENVLLRAVEILGPDAYGAQIGRYLSEKLRRDVTAPQVYMTLERLAKRGLVRSENTDPVPARGGRSRRRFIIEADGVRALRYTSAVLNAIPTSINQENPDATGRRPSESSVPPKGATIAVRIARIGEFKDEYEEFFLLAYDDKLQKHGEAYARRWAYRHATKTVFFAAVEWSKLILVLYLKFAGR